MLEVGSETVRVLVGGTGSRPPGGLLRAALDWIDDPVGLFDERPVSVADLWRAVMVAIVGQRCESVVVVHPADWPVTRVRRVVAAANAVAGHVVAVRADEWTAPPVAVEGPPAPRRRPRRGPLLVAAAVSALLAGAGIATQSPRAAPPVPQAAPVALVEGRVAVMIPRHWTVERVTGGPGSRRVQVHSPADPDVALHITQSYAPESTLTQTAEVLGRAIAGQPAGVFVDLRPGAAVAGRPAVAYSEVRAGRVIDWSVLQAGSTRVSIGCQSPPGRRDAIRAACEQAIRSARELGTDQPR